MLWPVHVQLLWLHDCSGLGFSFDVMSGQGVGEAVQLRAFEVQCRP